VSGVSYKKKLGYPLLAVIVVWCAGLLWFITIIPDEPASDASNVDAIVVLTGGGLRLERGFELLTQGRAPKMFISGVEDGVTLTGLLRNKEYKEFADTIPHGSVTLGHKARSTAGNASEIAEWVARENVKTIRLVTGNYHMPRSVRIIHRAIPDMIIIPEPVFPSHFENNEWWQFLSSIRLVISEYHKYMITLIFQ